MKKLKQFIPILLSLFLHLSVFVPQLGPSFFELFQKDSEQKNPMKVRIVGVETGKNADLIFIENKKKKINARSLRQKLSVPDLSALDSRINQMLKKNKSKSLRPSKALDNLKISNTEIKDFLKSKSIYDQTPRELLSAMDDTDVLFDLQVPKGVKEDELNKHEMVFYSFRKRTALAYVNSFYKELNSFERKNPHLRFPLTENRQKISGKITYDKNGDILKIETLRWSDITKLQDFFMDVLKNMSSLPNPPEAIIDGKDQFVINFTLTVNG